MKKLLALTLIFVMAVIPLCSCSLSRIDKIETDYSTVTPDTDDTSDGQDQTKDTNDSATDSTDGSNTPSTPSADGVVLSGENKYNIIYESTLPKSVANKIYLKLYSLDVSAKIGDYKITTDKATPDNTDAMEILVGLTNREASSNADTELKNDLDYTITVNGNKICIYARTEFRLIEAVTYFISNMSVTDDKLVVYTGPKSHTDTFKAETSYSYSISGDALSSYKIVIPKSAGTAEKNFSKTLSEYLMRQSGVLIDVVDDSTAAARNEILIGETNRPQSASLASSQASANGFLCTLGSGKLAVLGKNAAEYTVFFNSLKNTLEASKGKLTSAISMKNLSFSEMKELLVGAVSFAEKNEAVYPYVYTAAQLNAAKDPFGNNVIGSFTDSMYKATGIRFDFETNSSSVTFESTGGKFVVLINGVKSKEYTDTLNTITIDTSKRETNRVTILFPNAECGIKSMSLDGGATVTRHKFDQKILFIGDSITEGYLCSGEENKWVFLTSMALNADSVNQGNGGTRFDGTPFDSNIKDTFNPDVVIIAFGYNDWATYKNSPATVKKNAKQYTQVIKNAFPDAKIIGISPINAVGSNYTPEKGGEHPYGSATLASLQQARAAIEEAYTELGCSYIDGRNMVPADYKYYPGINKDGVHPNALGHSEYAKNLMAELAKLGVK